MSFTHTARLYHARSYILKQLEITNFSQKQRKTDEKNIKADYGNIGCGVPKLDRFQNGQNQYSFMSHMMSKKFEPGQKNCEKADGR